MRLSNKSTFSLICLIFLMAFVAVPAMAHIDGTSAESGHESGDAASHTPHPVVKKLTLKGAAADGYVKRGVFMLDFTFEAANTANEVALPRITTLGTSSELAAMFGYVTSPHADGGVSGTLTTGIPTDWVVTRITKNSDTSYSAEILANGAAGVFVLGIAQAAVAADTPNTGDTAIDPVYTKPDTDPDDPADIDGDETNPAKVRLVLDITAPLFTSETDTATTTATAPVVSPILPNREPLDSKWEHPFDLTFYVRDDMSNIIDFTFEADPDKVSFSGEGGTGMKIAAPSAGDSSATQYGVTVTPRRDVNISDGEEITITIKLSDKADNEGMITTKVKLKAHTATTVVTPPDETDETAPTVAITSAKGTGADAAKVIFTFTFSEALATTGANQFTVADINVSNAPTLVEANLTTTDNATFKLTITPQNDKFPVKVSFKSAAKIGDPSNNLLAAGANGLGETNTFTPEGVLGVEIDAPDPNEIGIDGSLTFTFTFAEAPADEPDDEGNLPDGAFTVSDIRASNAEPLVASNLRRLLADPDADDPDEVEYELDVTPMDATKPVTVELLARSVSNGGAGTDADPLLIAGEVDATWTPDTTAPVVTITAPTSHTNNVLMFTINFDEAITAALTVANLDIMGAKATPAPALAPTTASQNYTLTVTGTPGTAVTVNLKANAVMDAAGNSVAPLATAARFMIPSPPGPDTTPPVLAINHTPADGTELAADGKVTFTFTFTDASDLGTNDAAFTSGDITVTNYAGIPDFRGSGKAYSLVVTPANRLLPVMVTVAAGSVSDTEGNALAAAVSETFTPKDVAKPTVVITAARRLNSDGNIVFTFDFSEPLGTGASAFTSADIDRTSSNVARILGEPTMAAAPLEDAYTLIVEPPTPLTSVSITLKSGSVADPTGNALDGDQVGTWTPPVVTPEGDNPVVTITGPSLVDTVAGSTITITVTDNIGITNKLADGEVTVTGGSKKGFNLTETNARSHTATLTVTPDHGKRYVMISVAAGVVGDAAGNTNAAASKTIEAAPVITIPAGGYVVVVRERHANDTILSDQPTLSLPGIPVPTPATNIVKVSWKHMPDLKVLFDVAGTGTGGGALLVKEAHSQPANQPVNVGTVGISEIMWATDIGRLGNLQNDEQANQQWIELHNLNSYAAKVFIYARAGQDILGNANNDVARGVARPIVDVMTNYFNGAPGRARWTVKGQDGNTRSGVNFVSMARILPDKKSAYANADGARYNNRDGRHGGHWTASTVPYYRAVTIDLPARIYEYIGTPGRPNTFNPQTQPHLIAGKNPNGVPSNSIIINEVANLSNSNAGHEWIELRNLTNGEVNLRNYLISIVKAVDSDEVLYQFPANDNAKIPANGVFLLVASDPRDEHAQPSEHPLAIGWDVDRNAEDQIRGLGDNPPRYKITGNLNLPDNGEFVLILRRPDNHEGQRSGAHGGKGVAERGNADLDKVIDVAGYHPNLAKNAYPNPVSNTKLWPFHSFGRGPQFGHNKFDVNTVHVRQRTTTHDGLGGAGAHENKGGAGEAAFRNDGYTGIGYKRQAARSNVNGGTPGYHGIQRGKTSDGAKLVVSEIMLSQGDARTNLPQWIELYNPSDYAVVLDADAGWRIVIEEERIPLRTINFKSKGLVKRVLPNQTILVVSGAARDLGSDYLPASVVFPSTRVFNVYRELKDHFGMANRFAPFLNTDSFNLRIIDGKGNVSDEIGNLDGNVRTSDTHKWDFSEGTLTKDGLRTSLIRVADNGTFRNGLSMDESNVLPLGAKKMDDMVNLARHQIPMKYSWVRASQADLGVINIRHTWYGSEEDYGTPLHREGSVLPVTLSHFRPTLEDGKVVIRWVTESELDNAGFNIYRSETRDGEFTQVNEQMIQGNGTTAERSTYKWVDTSAKIGAVYYYQIEDVSFAGERQMLTTTKLKGLISAKGKLTTQWGELKEVQ